MAGAAVAWTLAPDRFRRPAAALAAFLAILPDLDLVPFYLDLDRGGLWGHRGFTHSLAFAGITAVAAAAVALRRRRFSNREAFAVLAALFAAAATHPILDACSRAGPGVPFFAPFDQSRYSLPFRKIVGVRPLASALFGRKGFAALIAEMIWIWIPSALLVSAGELWRRSARRPSPPASASPATPATDAPCGR